MLSAVELAQARIDVAANRCERGLREDGGKLRDAPHAARADPRHLAHASKRGVEVLDARAVAAARARRADLRAAAPPRLSSSSGSTADMSFALCTAMSTSRARSASSISLTNSRLPPVSQSGASCSRSPPVLMTTISARAARLLDERRHGPRLPQGECAAASADPRAASRLTGWASTMFNSSCRCSVAGNHDDTSDSSSDATVAPSLSLSLSLSWQD